LQKLKYGLFLFLLGFFVEKKQVLIFLKNVIAAFEKGNIFALKEAANHAIEEAALSNDKELARIALMAYCLYKMSGKHHMVKHGRWPEIKHDILFDLKKALNASEVENEEEFNYRIQATIDSVKTTDEKIGNYAQNLFEKAKVKYASTAYSMGLGLGQAASLTGAEKKELLRYIGITKISDREAVGPSIGERLRKLKRKFGAEQK